VQGDGELDRAQIGREVPAGLRHRLEHEGAQLLGEPAELPALERAQLRRIVDRLQQLVHRWIVATRLFAGGQVAREGAHPRIFSER
jgi:hypothetical protein